MTEEKEKRIQLNISPNEETIAKLTSLVEKYGNRHLNVSKTAKAAADLVNKFIDIYIHLVQQQDRELQEQLDQLRKRFTTESERDRVVQVKKRE